ncbi:hypothetical protein TNCV_4428131 [Trichonephila clavipes]|nr:hypothetical protein TNCV_4428131 [Trichonephila clavipes]
MQVIRRSDIGERQSQIAALNLATSTMRTILKNNEKILSLAIATTTSSATRITHSKNNTIEEMEKRLSIWIDDEIERNMPLSQSTFLIKRQKIGNNRRDNDLKSYCDAKIEGHSYAYIRVTLPRKSLWDVDWTRQTYCLASTLPRPQSLGFLLLEPPEIAEMPLATLKNLTTRIIVASADIARTPELFEHFRQFFVRQCQLCYDLRGRNFEQFM